MAFFDQFGGGLGRYTGAIDAAQPGAGGPAGGPGGGSSAQDRQILSDVFNGPGVKKGLGLRIATPSLIDQLLAQQPGGQAAAGAGPMGGAAQQAYMPLSQLAGAAGGAMGGGTPMAGGAPMGGAPGGTVLLRAPTGQTQAVPAAQVAYYMARGATRV